MKVVHLVPAMEQGGVETVVCDLVRELGVSWESVVVSKGGRMVKRIEAAGGRHVALDLKSKNPFTYLWRAWRLLRILRRERPDLVCVHSRLPAWIYVGACKMDSIVRLSDYSIVSLPVISYAHGANSVSRYSAVMTRGDLIITPSRFLADYLKANYGAPEEKIRVIPNAVDADRFDPEKLDRAFIAEKKREWGIREGDRVTMAIGRITPVKGLEGLIGDFARAVAEDRDSTACSRKLIIVGGADKHHLKYLESLKKLASTVHLSPSPIVFAGPQEKIPECIAIADEIVSANTTKPETFGLSVVEAYAMNKPVKAKRFGGVAEVMEAVEKAGKPTLREAALSLYAPELQAARTRTAYREIVSNSRA